jgi:hypothetical protein
LRLPFKLSSRASPPRRTTRDLLLPSALRSTATPGCVPPPAFLCRLPPGNANLPIGAVALALKVVIPPARRSLGEGGNPVARVWRTLVRDLLCPHSARSPPPAFSRLLCALCVLCVTFSRLLRALCVLCVNFPRFPCSRCYSRLLPPAPSSSDSASLSALSASALSFSAGCCLAVTLPQIDSSQWRPASASLPATHLPRASPPTKYARTDR